MSGLAEKQHREGFEKTAFATFLDAAPDFASEVVQSWYRPKPDPPGVPPVTIRDLLRTTLRLRPDRILLGEVLWRGSVRPASSAHYEPRWDSFDASRRLGGPGAGALYDLRPDGGY
jgi:hypothetical protein